MSLSSSSNPSFSKEDCFSNSSEFSDTQKYYPHLSITDIEKYLFGFVNAINQEIRMAAEKLLNAKHGDVEKIINHDFSVFRKDGFNGLRLRFAKFFDSPAFLEDSPELSTLMTYFFESQIKVTLSENRPGTRKNKDENPSLDIHFKTSQAAQSLLDPIFTNNARLNSISLKDSPIIGRDLVDRISKMTSMLSLREIDLTNTRLGDDDFFKILNSDNLENLYSLKLANNEISDNGLMEALNSKRISQLMELNLNGNRQSLEGTLDFAQKVNAARNSEYLLKIRNLTRKKSDETRAQRNQISDILWEKDVYTTI